jgi:PTH1 family peptidyl-tRNA hydrolase
VTHVVQNRLVVGLGNPGSKFEGTRHNIGAAIVHGVGAMCGGPSKRTPGQGTVVNTKMRFDHDAGDIVSNQSERARDKTRKEGVLYPSVHAFFLVPDTFMNLNGHSVRKFMDQHKFKLKKTSTAKSKMDEILVVVDDLSLPFGTLRIKPSGGSAGQNGMKSVISAVKHENFARLKIGIAPEGRAASWQAADTSKYVLNRFTGTEQDDLPQLMSFAKEVMKVVVGLEIVVVFSFHGTRVYVPFDHHSCMHAYLSKLRQVYMHRGVEKAMTVANSQTAREFVNSNKDTLV